MIRPIEGFSTESDPVSLRDKEILEDAEVVVHEARIVDKPANLPLEERAERGQRVNRLFRQNSLS